MFSIIDPKYESLKTIDEAHRKQVEDKILTWCGYEDSVINHINLVTDMTDATISREELEKRSESRV